MQALVSYNAGIMKKGIQYTIRNVSQKIDDALRKHAVRESTSLNTVALEALEAGAGIDEKSVRHHDLDALAGTWVKDDACDKALAAFDAIDEDLWK